MTNDERAFLNAICEYPDDDTARLVYADWLAEHGDADRGEFIRVEIELARTPPTTEDDERRRKVLLDRRAELLKQHRSAWLAPFGTAAKESSFERGFVQSLDVGATSFLESGEMWLSITPLTRVKFSTCYLIDRVTGRYRPGAAELFASPLLSRLVVIDLEGAELVAADLESLAANPNLSRLQELLLARNYLRNDGVRLLANIPQLAHLESLDLRMNSITDTGARAIAESPHLMRLRELRMTRNPIRDRGWRLLEDRFGDALVG